MSTARTYLLLAFFCTWLKLIQQTAPAVYTSHEDSSRITVLVTSLNSKEEDFSPVLYKQSMLFTSCRPSEFAIIHKNAKEKSSNIYVAQKKDSIHFSAPVLFPGKLNTFYNEGSLSLNSEATVMIYTANPRGRHEKNNLLLFISEKKNGEWQEPQPLPFCNDSFSYCHPSLKSDGKTLFFASDREGSLGGMDIYFSTLDEGKWSEPQNAGPAINTPYNEVFPFLSPANVLYFSSNKPGGKGGLDIYTINMSDPMDNIASAVEEPINSLFDDFGIQPDSTGEEGYFSSSRNESTKDDIYYYRIVNPDFSKARSPEIKKEFCYTFFEETAFEAPDSLDLEYEWNLGDGTKMQGLKVRHCYHAAGTYNVELNIIDRSTGALFYNHVSYKHIIPEPEQLSISDTLAGKLKLRFGVGKSAIPGYIIEKYYWDFGDHTYSSGKYVEHVYKTPGTYQVTLGVSARRISDGEKEKFKLTKPFLVKNKAGL